MKKILAVILIAAILIALFLLAKHDKESQITQNQQQTASTSVSAQVQEELPPSIEQQEVLKDASATIKPDEGAYVQLTEKTNIVEYKLKDNAEWKSAELNQKFTEGDTLRTGSESEGLLIFADGSSVKLSSLSQVTIDPVQKEINLSIGKIFVSFFKGSASPKVVTPNAVAAALGTMWVHELKEDGTSEVNVLEGQVNFTSGGESQIVNEGNFTKALHKKPPLKPQQFNVDNYAKSEKILRKVNVKKLADLHKKHDVEFYKKLKDNPEFQKKYEEKVKQLKIEQIEKKKVIENKLQDKKADIQEKVKENKLQQNEEKKIKAEDLKKKVIENKKEQVIENKLQQNENKKIKTEDLKKKIIEEKKEQVIENKLNSDKKLQIQENIRENKLQQNEEKKIKAEDLKKKIIEEKKEEPLENKLDSDKKLQIQEKVKEEKLLKDQDNKKILEDKKIDNTGNKKLLPEKKLQTEDNKKVFDEKKVQELKKKIEEKKIQNTENKKPQIQQENKKKVVDDKKNQLQQNPDNKKKLLEEKKINEKKLLINR